MRDETAHGWGNRSGGGFGEWGGEGEDVAVGVAGDEVAEAVGFVGGFEEDGSAVLFDGGAVVIDLFGDDDDGSAADGAAPSGVGAEVEFAAAEEDAGVVVVAEVDGESEDVAVEGDGDFDVGDLEDGGGGGGEHGGSIVLSAPTAKAHRSIRWTPSNTAMLGNC